MKLTQEELKELRHCVSLKIRDLEMMLGRKKNSSVVNRINDKLNYLDELKIKIQKEIKI